MRAERRWFVVRDDREELAFRLGEKSDLVDKLDDLLECPNDRAFVLCSSVDCTHNTNGHCDIYLVIDRKARNEGEPCYAYAKST